MLTGPEITRITGESKDQLTTEDTNETRHHEQQGGVQKTILEQVSALVPCMEEMGNPFIEESGDILSPNINCRLIDVKDSRWDQGKNDFTHLYRRGFFREQYNCTNADQGISWYYSTLLIRMSFRKAKMGQVMRKRVLCHMRTTKAQISLRMRAV